MKKILIAIILIITVIGGYFLFRFSRNKNQAPEINMEANSQDQETQKQEEQKQTEIKVEILKTGEGTEAENGDQITVHYTGWLEDGTKFDSSLDRGQPFSFVLGRSSVIQGWDLGLLGVQAGEQRKLTIPSELGYGERGTPGGPIPPNATLIFEIQVLSID